MTDFLADWKEEGQRLKRRFIFKNFTEALDFVNRVGNLAEEVQHHPDIHLFYNEVELELWTHTVDDVTQKDWDLAISISSLRA